MPYYLKHYKIDFEKVKDIEDIKAILQLMDLSFETFTEDQYNKASHLLKLVDKDISNNITLD